jgi:Skp family chaperone for outer membrane proteins
MKKSIVALLLSGLALSPAFAEKVAVVDLEVIKQQYTKAVDNAKGLGSAFEGAKAQMASMVEKLKKLQSEAEAVKKDAENPTLNDAARTQKKAEFEAKAQEFLKFQQETQQFERSAGSSFQQRAQQLDRDILTDVRAKTEVVAKEKGVDIVVPKGMALFSADAIDISADVVKLLNAAYAANPVNPTAPVAPVAPAAPEAKKPAEPAKK